MTYRRRLAAFAALACTGQWMLPAMAADAPAAGGIQAPAQVGWGPHGKKLYYFMVLGNATPGADAELNRWYDRIHAPVMIESGDFVWAQRFVASPVKFAAGVGSQSHERQYLVIFAIETNDIAKVVADANRRLRLPRNVSSKSLDYGSLLSYTFEALGPPITQKDARRLLAEETAAGHVPPADAPASPPSPGNRAPIGNPPPDGTPTPPAAN